MEHGKNIVFRADEEFIKNLDLLVKKTGINRSSLIRYLVNKEINKFGETGNLSDSTK